MSRRPTIDELLAMPQDEFVRWVAVMLAKPAPRPSLLRRLFQRFRAEARREP